MVNVYSEFCVFAGICAIECMQIKVGKSTTMQGMQMWHVMMYSLPDQSYCLKFWDSKSVLVS